MGRNYLLKLWHDSAERNNRLLIDLIEPTEQARVLDIGSFTGQQIIERVKNIHQPDLYGLEIEEKYVNLSRRAGVKAVQGDAEKKLPFKANYFDIVTANQIIEHLVNVDGFMSEINRVLKVGGYLVLATENLSSWHNIFALTMGWQAFSQHLSYRQNIGNPLRLPETTGFKPSQLHQKIFTLKGLIELAELYQLQVEGWFGAGYYPLPQPVATILSCLDPWHSAFIGIKARKVAGR